MPVQEQHPLEAAVHDSLEDVAEVGQRDLGADGDGALVAAGLAGAGTVRHGREEHRREAAPYPGGELGGQDHVRAERQVRTVPLDGAQRQHREVGAGDGFGTETAAQLRERDQLGHRGYAVGAERAPSSRSSISSATLLSPASLSVSRSWEAVFSSSTCSVINHWRKICVAWSCSATVLRYSCSISEVTS